ncbi:hypothetical protein MAPG_11217 [Magnaporthiopsis poae ATCC 64411]|uniref:Uncharacterized protein n=1 Tax=Magnaporthiopsis poae (strain ATCC 64411 / 73-15) TaxID=644358 RepID=A0A0C4EEP3_MAGP6|nr:hypothetical protein MAPG_11217 [Magnaporthiopsis poae ATCC 64411]
MANVLAARDQENLAFSRQTVAAAKSHATMSSQLTAKTPGALYPKTPLKVPLNDENTTTVFGKGMTGNQSKHGNENVRTVGKGKAILATPLEPRTGRAPLGNKTTNAKARTGQLQGVKSIVQEFEKSQPPATASRRPRARSPKTESAKLEIHTDVADALAEPEIEYVPPKPKNLPYESDVFPDGVLTLEGLKPENRLKGFYNYYHDPVDANGVSRKEKQFAEAQKRALEESEARIRKDLDEFDWSIGDVPGSRSKRTGGASAGSGTATSSVKTTRMPPRAPSAAASRAAAQSLSIAPRTTMAPKVGTGRTLVKSSKPAAFGLPIRKALPPMSAGPRATPAETALPLSRTTLGYTKGRTASSMLKNRPDRTMGPSPPPAPSSSSNVGPAPRSGLVRSVSTASTASDSTITPARFAQSQARKEADDERRLEFLSIFEKEEDDDGDLGGSVNFNLDDGMDDDFKLTVDF